MKEIKSGCLKHTTVDVDFQSENNEKDFPMEYSHSPDFKIKKFVLKKNYIALIFKKKKEKKTPFFTTNEKWS